MKFFKTLSIGSFAVVTSLILVASYDYFVGHKLIPNKPVVLSPAQISAVNATSPTNVSTVTYTNVAGTSNVRQLVKSPVEVSYSSDDKTPLTVSTGVNGQNSNYLAKFKNYALGTDNTVLTVTNTGDLKTQGSIEADDGNFGSVDTGKVSLDGVLKFKSRSKDPTKTDSSTKNKYGLLWLNSTGTALNFMDSTDASYQLLMTNASGKVGIGTNTPSQKLHISSGNLFIEDGYLALFGSTDVGITSDTNTSNLKLRTNNADRLVVNSTGYVGVGTTNPNFSLHVQNSNSAKLFTVMYTGSLQVGPASNSGAGVQLEDTQIPDAAEQKMGFISFGATTTNGTTNHNSASIQGVSTEAWDLGTSEGAGLSLLTTTNGTNSRHESMRIADDGNVGIGTSSPTQKLDINGDTIRIRENKTPSSASASCDKGEVVWDTDYVYVCIANNTWKRSGLATW